MLAPLKNRALLERDDGDPQADLSPPSVNETSRHIAELESEIASLRSALRQSRQTQRRSAPCRPATSLRSATKSLD